VSVDPRPDDPPAAASNGIEQRGFPFLLQLGVNGLRHPLIIFLQIFCHSFRLFPVVGFLSQKKEDPAQLPLRELSPVPFQIEFHSYSITKVYFLSSKFSVLFPWAIKNCIKPVR
jgi:hypothetical protein